MTPTRADTAALRDQEAYRAARDAKPADLIAYAARKSGLSALRIARDHLRMARSPARINLVEFVRTGLYDPGRFSEAERARFISNDLHWPVAHQCNDTRWSGVAEDKVLAGTILGAGGVPVPRALAVADRTPRDYPGLPRLDTPQALQAFLADQPKPVFAKTVAGMVSFGALRIEAADGHGLTCTGHGTVPYAEFLEGAKWRDAYLLQPALDNHAALAPFATGLATIRMVNLVTADGVRCPAAVLKLPAAGNVADAFWRPGNLACALDPATGTVRTVARRGIETEFLSDHPETPGLMGLTLPDWEALREVNARAARLFAPIRYQSTDIALTPDGPVVVELNYGGGFDLPQYASGEGLLTDEMRAFLDTCGAQLPPARRALSGLLRRRG
jgi:hypothetical protein